MINLPVGRSAILIAQYARFATSHVLKMRSITENEFKIPILGPPQVLDMQMSANDDICHTNEHEHT